MKELKMARVFRKNHNMKGELKMVGVFKRKWYERCGNGVFRKKITMRKEK